MQTATYDRLIRMPEVLDATGEKKSSYYQKMAAGLAPRTIKLSTHAAAVPMSEIRAFNAARIRGAGEAELKALVADLHARRVLAA
jgi:predicted DNA-binding transcriptional regulator AlpA